MLITLGLILLILIMVVGGDRGVVSLIALCGNLLILSLAIWLMASGVPVLPGLPVVSKHKLTKYGDEFVQDSHLFPFSPVQIFHVVPLIIHNQDAIIHLTDTSRICIKLYVTTGSFYHTYTNASRNVINWRIWPHFRL